MKKIILYPDFGGIWCLRKVTFLCVFTCPRAHENEVFVHDMNAFHTVSVEGEEEMMEVLMSRGLARHQGKKNWKGQFNGSENKNHFTKLKERMCNTTRLAG